MKKQNSIVEAKKLTFAKLNGWISEQLRTEQQSDENIAIIMEYKESDSNRLNW